MKSPLSSRDHRSAKMVNGQELDVQVSEGNLPVNRLKVTKTEIAASNGVTPLIDTVVMPE